MIPLTVFYLKWTYDIKADLITLDNPSGRLTHSNLECVGLVLFWLVMEVVLPLSALKNSHVAFFSNNQPTMNSVECFVTRGSYFRPTSGHPYSCMTLPTNKKLTLPKSAHI